MWMRSLCVIPSFVALVISELSLMVLSEYGLKIPKA